MNKNQEMLAKGSFGQLVLNLCIPTIVIMLVMVIYNMADTFFIGQTGDPDKIAALSLCAPIFSILSGLGTLFGSGGCTAISMALGKREYDKVKAYTSLCFTGALVLGAVFLVIVLIAVNPISRALGADDSTVGFTVSYLRVIACGAPVILFNNIFCNLIRADGAAKESMVANLLGTVSNIALDALFILAFHWDMAGAAVATVIGNVLSSAYLLYYITRKQPAFSIHPRYLLLKSAYILPVVTLGLPMACSTLLMSFSNMISNRLMIAYGSTALAAQGVAGKIGMILSMTAMGICMGMQPAVSFNYGAGNYGRMRKIIRNTGIFTVLFGTLLTGLCFVLRNQIIAAFIDNDTVIACGQTMVVASLLIGPFYGLYQLCQTFLQSTGKAGYATFASLLDKGIIFLPVLFAMNHLFGMYGVAFSSAVTLVFSLLAAAILSLHWNRAIEMRTKQISDGTGEAR